ncbi:MAG: hypothetical protein HQL48_06585, partial [Gammaproteobacteria bacterium]|nr:hypothetical protein [Gammaproteobacteria bacterium]
MSIQSTFERHRVKMAQITFYLFLIYTFAVGSVTVNPLTSTLGILGVVVTLFGVVIRSLSAG